MLEAIYEHGVLRPIEDPGLAEYQRVLLELRELPSDDADQRLDAWHEVYQGLSEDQLAEVEAIVLDRSNFLTRGR
jgi:predicted DNA-binding antitoxin AbrB/MazE fold protein